MTKASSSEQGETPARCGTPIVIGSGISGLTAAAALARCGQRVLVLEQHSGHRAVAAEATGLMSAARTEAGPCLSVAGVACPNCETDVGRSAHVPRSPLKFFLLVFIVSAPVWLIGAAVEAELMPGLSLSALGAICPMLAALVLVYQEREAAGVMALLKRSFDFKRIRRKRWYLPIVALMPGVSVLVYGLMRWMNLPVPAPQFSAFATLLMFLAFIAGALGEELGWSGYAIKPMQARWGALQASLALGPAAALWRIVPLVQAHRPVAWMAWWCLYAVPGRVLIVWLYNNTDQSVFAAALFHTMLNLSWMRFPLHGSFFDVRLAGLVMAFVAATVVVVWRHP